MIGFDFLYHLAGHILAAIEFITAEIYAVFDARAVAQDMLASALLVDTVLISGDAAADAIDSENHVAPVPLHIQPPVLRRLVQIKDVAVDVVTVFRLVA